MVKLLACFIDVTGKYYFHFMHDMTPHQMGLRKIDGLQGTSFRSCKLTWQLYTGYLGYLKSAKVMRYAGLCLHIRRRDARLCMLYKIDRNLVAIKKDKRLIPHEKRTRHSQARAYRTLSCTTERRKNSFFPRTVRDWNALPPDITEAESLAAFKAQVTQLIY